jgi:hypothetical protein
MAMRVIVGLTCPVTTWLAVWPWLQLQPHAVAQQ